MPNSRQTTARDLCVEGDYEVTVLSKSTALDADVARCGTKSAYQNPASSGTWDECDAEATGDVPAGSNAGAQTCADVQAGWLNTQASGYGCTTEGKLFHSIVLGASVAEATDAAVDTYCTPPEDPLCSDWVLNYGRCSGNEIPWI